MKISLIITTYNREDALNVVLKSVAKQTLLPDEILIADDGSTQATAEVIQAHQKICLLYTSPSPRDRQKSRMPSSA